MKEFFYTSAFLCRREMRDTVVLGHCENACSEACAGAIRRVVMPEVRGRALPVPQAGVCEIF